ncbi:hypothetical protein D3C72_1476700 [compost metagenome]
MSSREVGALHRGLDGLRQICVIQHHQRVLATHLQLQLGEAAAGGLQDLPAGIRRTGKTESFHPGRFDQGLAHDTAASHNQVEGASGQLRTMDYFAQRPG